MEATQSPEGSNPDDNNFFSLCYFGICGTTGLLYEKNVGNPIWKPFLYTFLCKFVQQLIVLARGVLWVSFRFPILKMWSPCFICQYVLM